MKKTIATSSRSNSIAWKDHDETGHLNMEGEEITAITIPSGKQKKDYHDINVQSLNILTK